MKKKENKKLFIKYLISFMSIMVISFLALGIMLYVFINNYRTTEKSILLTKNANSIAKTISESGLEKDSQASQSNPSATGYFLKNEDLLIGILNTVSDNIDSDIFITDSSGVILLRSKSTEGLDNSINIPENIMSNVRNGEYAGIGNLGNLYNRNYYFVGIPINAENQLGENVAIGAIIISSNAGQMDTLALEIFKLFLIAALISFLLALIITWLFSYHMVKPLKQMAKAASEFGHGDFSKRVSVKSTDELGLLSTEFNNMADSLETSETVRKDFIANVSHELKTPMTTISGFIDGILDGTIKAENQTYYLNIISSEIKRLSRLVRSMLNLSQIDSDEIKLNKTPVDLLSVLINVLTSFENKIKEKNIKLVGLENLRSVTINADGDMIYQVIYNLVENATKFVNKNGYIKFNLCEKTGEVYFSIENSGEKISKKDINLIFDRFYKTDKSRSQDKTGVGLGLYISKKILQLHSGKIKASNNNQSCKFEFFIPYSNPK